LEVERSNGRAQSLYQKFGFRDQQRFLMSKWIS
jgi:ribosomal protein S18 acetylase RimI-like enzyme